MNRAELVATPLRVRAEDATRALPWPLSAIVGALLGDRLAAAKHATQANPYAPNIPTQLELAVHEQTYRGLRGGYAGLSGSMEEWDQDPFGAPDAATFGQDVTSGQIPRGRLIPWNVDNPRDANQTRGYTGPVIPAGSDTLYRWGSTTRFPWPRIIRGTLLPPGERTPTPREVVEGYVAENPRELRLDDPYLAADGGELY